MVRLPSGTLGQEYGPVCGGECPRGDVVMELSTGYPARHPTRHAYGEALDFYLTQALQIRASDIHFAPRHTGGDIRLRVSGELQTLVTISNLLDWEDLLKEVKRRCGLSFGKGFAQDSRFSQTHGPHGKR